MAEDIPDIPAVDHVSCQYCKLSFIVILTDYSFVKINGHSCVPCMTSSTKPTPSQMAETTTNCTFLFMPHPVSVTHGLKFCISVPYTIAVNSAVANLRRLMASLVYLKTGLKSTASHVKKQPHQNHCASAVYFKFPWPQYMCAYSVLIGGTRQYLGLAQVLNLGSRSHGWF